MYIHYKNTNRKIQNLDQSSNAILDKMVKRKERREDALALRAEERRDKLR